MGNYLKKLTGLFSDSKTRILVLLIAIMLIVGIVWGVSLIINKLQGPLGPESGASIRSNPNITSIPGGWDKAVSPEYAKQVKERNKEQAQQAAKKGTSALPTIIESSVIKEDLDPASISGGVGFSDLKRLEGVNPDELKLLNARCKAIGALVFDKQGNTLGTVSENGIVKDPCGRNMGTVGDDCNVRDANGKIIGKASDSVLGTAIYDPQGRLIGTLGPDGQVRDLSGKIIGKMDSNGVLKDLDGHIITTGNPNAKDTLIYDENGNLVGIAGADGTIRDASGKIIGALGADGLARGLNGEIIGKPGSAQVGSLVYDKNGKLLGVVGADGKVRDAQGRVIGSLGVDGKIRDAKGIVIGSASKTIAGAPVYDSSGRLVGTVGADGIVRDAQGNVIGTIGADGLVRDAKGNIVGKAGGAALGIPVYDENGNLIGIAGVDGIVRDSKGNIIGKLDPLTGNVIDNKGKIIGKVAANALAAKTTLKPASSNISPLGAGNNKPVYDSSGRLIGTVGEDGVVRDAQGNIIGTAGADGVVRDSKGNIIGSVSDHGVVRDAKGNIIGTVGADGLVRDAKGNVIGTVGADGIARDAQGNIIGTVGEDALVRDAQGNIIGTVGADGLVRDAKGNIIGTVGADGVVRDVKGNIIGKTNHGVKANQTSKLLLPTDIVKLAPIGGADGRATEQLMLAKQSQDLQYAQQQQSIDNQQIQSAMTAQAGQLFTAWAPPAQVLVAGNPTNKDLVIGKIAMAGANANATVNNKNLLAKAGDVIYAVLDTAVNTDQASYVMATIVEGPLKGAKLLGTVQRQGEKALLSFNVLNSEKFSRSIGINAVAIDPDTARTALASDVDRHIMLRYGTLFASAFVQGYADAVQTAGTTVISGFLTTAKTYPDLSTKGKLLIGLGKAGSQYSNVLAPMFNTPPTVTVNSGTGLGILFLADLASPSNP